MKNIKYYNRLSTHITYTILIPVFIVSGFLLSIMYTNISHLTEEKFTNELQEINYNYVSFIDLKLNYFASNAKLTATFLENEKTLNEARLLNITDDIIKSDSLIYGAAIVFVKGEFQNYDDLAFFYSFNSNQQINHVAFKSSKDKDYFNYYEAQQEWWDIPSKSFTSGWTNPYFDFGAGKVDMITYYHPFFFKNKFAGIVTVDISLEKFRELILINGNTTQESYQTTLHIIAHDSTIIYSKNKNDIGQHIDITSNPDSYKFNPEKSYEIIGKALKGQVGKDIIITTKEAHKYLAFYLPLHSVNWSAISVIPYSVISDATYKELLKTIFIILVFLLILISSIAIMSHRITVPIRELSRLSVKIAEGNYQTDLNFKSKNEIGVLSRNFTQMKEKLLIRESQLKDANEQLMELDIAKNKFLLLISHEIRTPLNGIIGFTTILDESIDDPELKELFVMLDESVNRLDRFSRKALEITQMQTVGKQMKKVKKSVKPLIENIIDAHTPRASEKQLSISSDYSKNDEVLILEEYFTSAMDELLDNAIKFSFEKTDIFLKTYRRKDFFHISVSNTGEVVPQNKTKEITKSFGLANAHVDRNIGLGLSYVKSFLDIHNAHLDIISSKEKTEIIMSFPL